MKTERTGRRGEAGFSLVEVTLALLVVAVGMTAAFSLFPEGIQSTRAAVSNTETALFADYVFATLELAAGVECVNLEDENKTAVDPGALPGQADDFISISFARKDADNKNFRIRTTSGKPNVFYWMPDYFGVDGLDEMDSDYFKGKLKTAAFTYTLTLKNASWKAASGVPMYAVLKVWPGEFGDDVKESDLNPKDARIFYREILPVK